MTTRKLTDAQYPGWIGHVQEKVTFALDADVEPPGRLMFFKAAGDVAFELPDGSIVIRTVLVGDTIDKYAVVQINTTGTTIAVPTTNIELFR